MATLRPSLNPTGSYHRSRSPGPEKDTLHYQWQKSPRTRSRSRNPKPYNPDSPKRYGPNESRSRKPPQSPEVEDGGFGDDGVRMRGKLEQQPMIISINGNGESLPVASSDKSATITPPSSDSEDEPQEKCLAQKQGKTREAPVNYNAKDKAQASRQINTHDSSGFFRGRHDMPRLDTGVPQNGSLAAELPQLERARSPYASGPKDTRPKDARRFSGEQILSPTTLTPNVHDHGARSRSQRPAQHKHGDSGSGSGSGSDRGSYGANRPARPALDRRASAMSQLERTTPPTTASRNRHRPNHHSSSDDSGNDYVRYKTKVAPLSPESKKKAATSYFDSQRLNEKPRSSQHPSSPPRTPAAADYPSWGQSLNREALLNVSAALLGSSSSLDSRQRKASPRPSPQVSPNHSPYPSPPRTPPEPIPHRMNPVSNLKHDSPKSNSRPSSPLSSGPPSPKMPDPGPRSQRHGESEVRPARYTPRSRATSPLPTTRRPEPEAPRIDIRSPSPLLTEHTKSSSHETNDRRTPTRYMPAYANGGTLGATLQPARPDRRQRSASNADARGSRPNLANLSISPPVIHQADVEYLSPTSENTPAHFNALPHRPSLASPTSPDGRARPALADPAASTHRSRSSVPAPDAHVLRSNSTMPLPTSGHRSRSSAPAPRIALSDQPNPGSLPLCPRPDPVANCNDWYTLDGCDYFAICPDCRHNIFGTGYERYFKLRSSKFQGRRTHCQINDPWIRMACIASINSRHPDVKLLTDLANVSEDYEACAASTPAQRDWYRVEDDNADEDDHLADFQVCTHCVHSIEVLLPALKGTFFRYKGHQTDSTPRPCSLRFDNIRFGEYIDKCDQAAKEAVRSRKEPDMSDFVWYHKKETVIGECTRDQVLIGRDWHLNALIPEFAICEQCYYDTVRPAIKKNYNLAKTVAPVAKHISDGVSCQLYSPRMKEIFERACEEDDNEYLKKAVLMRRDLQVEILAARMEVQHHPRDKKAQKELDELNENWTMLEKKRH